MPLSFHAVDEEFAAATGANVHSGPGSSTFDNPPNAFNDLVITANEGDPDPRHFETGDTYDLSWSGHGGNRTIEDAVVVRSDEAPGGGGIIVFEGTDSNGDLVQIIWTPGFNLEQWYWNNFNPSAEPGFYVSDTNSTYSHEFICFADDTRIATALGGLRAADIWEGDRLETLDAGPQPVIWTRRRAVRGHGANAPVLFTPGSIGNHAPLRLSQNHRVMIRSPVAELMFGTSEVLVPAKALANGDTIRIDPCPAVAYVHMLLPAHHLLFAEGALCESLMPGDIARQRAGLPGEACRSPYAPARRILSYAEAVALIGSRPPDPEDSPAPVMPEIPCV